MFFKPLLRNTTNRLMARTAALLILFLASFPSFAPKAADADRPSRQGQH